ncbi:MAG: hypothetical protein ACRD6W_03490, partial [Nitrososphaerales archaeon]
PVTSSYFGDSSYEPDGPSTAISEEVVSTGTLPPCNANDRAVSTQERSARAIQTTGLGFTPLASPVRVADTRTSAIDPSTYAGDTLCPAGQLTVDMPSSVPSDAGAVVGELTAINPSAAGYLSAFPAGTNWPGTANLNFATSQTVGNLVTVGLGTDPSTGSPAVTIHNGAGTRADTDFTLDLYGYYAPESATSGEAFIPMNPVRVLDTRGASGSSVPKGSGRLIGAGASVTFSVPGVNGDNVPAGAGAVALNVAVTNTTAVSYLQCYPAGSPPTSASPTATIFWNVPGSTIANQAVMGLPSSGTITCTNAAGDTDMIVDVDGYYRASGGAGSLFNALATPKRLLDTRPVAVPAGGTTASTVSPSSATAAVLNITDIANGGNYLTAYPAGASAPTAASVNYFPPDPSNTVANGAYVATGSGGEVEILSASSSANVVVDEFGFFAASS